MNALAPSECEVSPHQGVHEALSETLKIAVSTAGSAYAMRLAASVGVAGSSAAGTVLALGEAGRGRSEFMSRLLEIDHPDLTRGRVGTAPIYYRHAERLHVEPFALHSGGARIDSASLVPTAELQRSLVYSIVDCPAALLAEASLEERPSLHGYLTDPVTASDLSRCSGVLIISDGLMPLCPMEVRFIKDALRAAQRVCFVLAAGEVWCAAEAVRERVLAQLAEVWWEYPERLTVVGDEGPGSATGLEAVAEWARALRDSTPSPLVAQTRILRAGISDLISRIADLMTSVEDDVSEAARETSRGPVVDHSSSWLARLGYEISKLRNECAEEVNQTLRALERDFESVIEHGLTIGIDQLCEQLGSNVERAHDHVVRRMRIRLQEVAERYLGGRAAEFDVDFGDQWVRRLGGVAFGTPEATMSYQDPGSEIMTTVGNFSSGRQTLSILSSVASGLGGPLTLAGAAIGLVFVKMGKASRRNAIERGAASRWVKAQIAEAARLSKHAIDLELNEAQLVLNIAMRESTEQAKRDQVHSLEVQTTMGRARAQAQAQARTRLEEYTQSLSRSLEKCDRVTGALRQDHTN